MTGPLLILDTATLYYRSFYALPESMVGPNRLPHNAIRGILSTIGRLREQYQPRGIVAAWDVDWRPQWRVDLLPTYKTHRLAEEGEATDESGDETEMIPDTLSPQISVLKELLGAGGIPVMGAPHCEADDVIATMCSQEDHSIAVSGDRDLVQVVRESVSMLLMTNGGMDKWPLLDPQGVEARFGVPARAYVDFAVLRGDPSDGLPGVRGIGEKTAVALLQEWGSLEAVYEKVEKNEATRPLTPRLIDNLRDSVDYVRAAIQVSTARQDVPLPSWQAERERQRDSRIVSDLSREWGLEKFLNPAFAD